MTFVPMHRDPLGRCEEEVGAVADAHGKDYEPLVLLSFARTLLYIRNLEERQP